MKLLHLVSLIGFALSLAQATAIPQPWGEESSLESRDNHADHHHEPGLTEGVEAGDIDLDDEEHHHLEAREEDTQLLQARAPVVVPKKKTPKKKPGHPKKPVTVVKPVKKPVKPKKIATGPTAKKAPITTAAVAKTQLAALVLRNATDTPPTPYSRNAFPHWRQEKGCNARETVLKRDATSFTPPTVGCVVNAGSWYSVYDGKNLKFANLMEIDHVVPLKDAWDAGAHGWASNEIRAQFANDYNGLELLAVSQTSNNAKSDKIPGGWWPEDKAYHCKFAIRYVNIKHQYKLSVLKTEKKALEDKLATC